MADDPADASREQRLAAQLRENLKRRKAQARQRADGAAEKEPEADGAPPPASATSAPRKVGCALSKPPRAR